MTAAYFRRLRTRLMACAFLAGWVAVHFEPRADAATAFVKSATNRAWSTTAGATFTGTVTAGNVIAVFVGTYPKAPLLNSVTATCVSGPFTLLDGATVGTYSRAAIGYAIVATTGPCTVTASAAAGTTFIDLVAHEISGVDISSPLDNNQHRINVQLSPGAAANAITSGNITTTKSGDYIFAAAFNESLNGGLTITAGTGYTSRQQDLANVLKSEDRILTTAGSTAATFTTNLTGTNFLTGILAFQPSGGGVPDTTPPTVSMTAPVNNTVVAAAVTVSASASDNVGVAGVQFLLDGIALGAEDTASPHSIPWNTTTTSDGLHLLSARARDAAGNVAPAASVTVTVDNQAPTVPSSLTATVLSPTQVALSWTASSDNIGVAGYRVFRNGIQIGSPSGSTFQDNAAARGTTSNYAVGARDTAGNVSVLSPAVAATTPALIVSNVQSSSIGLTTAAITWTTDIAASSIVEYGATAAYGQVANGDVTPSTNHSVTLTGLNQNATYHFRAVSADSANNRVTSADLMFTTLFGNQGGLFQNDVLVTGMVLPTGIRFLPNGDLLVLEVAGRVSRIPAGTAQVSLVPFLLLPNVGSVGTQGLMELVLDPDFATNHFYYVFYTQGTPNRDRVSRFTATADLTGTVSGSEVVLYEDPQDAATEHHGGALAIGSDGTLYIGTGDHLDGNVSQLLTSPRGKILRINRDGTIPSDNPFDDGAGPNVDAIWAIGFRDPSHGSVDAATGTLYVGDGGGIDLLTSQEEIDLVARGANYGWPVCEGASCGDPSITAPIHAYGHNGRDAAIVGGFVYRAVTFPPALQGSYFFADTDQRWIRALTFDPNGAVTGLVNFEPPDGSLDGPYGDIVALTQGPDGALYYVDRGNTDGIGTIRRIRCIGNPPVASILAPANGSLFRAGDVISFSGSGSDQEDGILPASAFTWTVDFLRGGQTVPRTPQSGITTGTFQIPTAGVDFSGDARYRITLTVRDSTGLQSSTAATIFPQKVTLTFDSVPSGLTLSIDNVAAATPFTRETAVGFSSSVNAINQSQGSTNYTFASWSDAGAQQHVIVAPGANQSYVASYTASSQPNNVIALDGTVHGQRDNGSTSASTVVVGPMGTPTAGSTIVCEFTFNAASTLVSVADNVNAGVYLPAVSRHTNWSTPATRYGMYYKENVAAANTTVTLTYSPANTRGAMSCQAWKGTRPEFALDSTFIQAQDGSTANPLTGPALTPFGDGRLIVGALGTRTVAATAGAGYTGVDVNSTSRLFPQYQIQTTKAPTAGGFLASADTWYNQMAAFAPNTGGLCDSAVILDWTGGTNGATVSVANLAASTKGGRRQPGADFTSGWQLWGAAAGMTYTTSAYRPFARSLDCAFYSGSGSGSLGIKYSTTEAAHAALYFFDTTSPTVSAGVCFRTDLPNTDVGGPTDVFTIYANTGTGVRDFSNVAVWGSGPRLTIYLETGGSDNPNAGNVPIVSGRDYWLDLRFVKDGNHSVTVYDGCGSSQTLVGTVTHPALPNASVPNYLVVGSAGALTATKGFNFYYGAIKLDYLYGRPLRP